MQRTVVLVIGAVLLLLGWDYARIPELPRPVRVGADVGAVKHDLFVFARAERAFFASSGHYVPMSELRDRGLLSLPPEIRWPYSYYVVVPSPRKFLIVAMAQGPLGGRPLALAIDERMDMHELRPRDLPGPHHHRPRQLIMWKT